MKLILKEVVCEIVLQPSQPVGAIGDSETNHPEGGTAVDSLTNSPAVI